MKEQKSKSLKYIKAAEAYAQTGSIREAAKRAGVSESTLYLWRKEKEFQELVDFFSKLFIKEICQGLTQATKEVVDKLREILKEKLTPEEAVEIANLLLTFFERLSHFKEAKIGFEVEGKSSLAELIDEYEGEKRGEEEKKE